MKPIIKHFDGKIKYNYNVELFDVSHIEEMEKDAMIAHGMA